MNKIIIKKENIDFCFVNDKNVYNLIFSNLIVELN